MNFPISKLDKDAYLDNINTLLHDNEILIVLDTNIFSLLYKLYSAARNEFFNWIKPYVVSKKLKIPHWAMNEYTNHFLRDKTNQYFSPLDKVGTIEKEFKEIKNFLKMNVDDSLFQGTSYANRDQYINDLELIENKLSNIKVATRKKNRNYLTDIHNQIEENFKSAIFDGDIYEILKKVNEIGNMRFSHKIPPGFEDGIKELNSYGDLIIWYEILNYCNKNSKKKLSL